MIHLPKKKTFIEIFWHIEIDLQLPLAEYFLSIPRLGERRVGLDKSQTPRQAGGPNNSQERATFFCA